MTVPCECIRTGGRHTKGREGLVDGLRLLQPIAAGQRLGQALTASQINQIQHPCMPPLKPFEQSIAMRMQDTMVELLSRPLSVPGRHLLSITA